MDLKKLAMTMMISLGGPVVAGSLAISAPAAAASEVSTLIDAVEDKYEAVEVLRADFTQVSKSQLYGEETQSGTVTLKRPSMMRWEFAGDGKQFVTDGQTMWIYNAADKQVIRYNDFSAQASTADSLLQSLHQLSELFDIQLTSSDPATGHVLALSPKDAESKAQLKKVVLHLDKDLVVQKVELTDAFDGVTELSFQDVQLGGEVSDATFQFDVPAGVEVIDAGS